MSPKEAGSTNWKKLISVGLKIIFVFLLFTYLYKVQNLYPFPHQGDQTAYLELAVNLHEGDGFINRSLSSFRPTQEITHKDGARSPLYPFFLSLVSKPDFETYWKTRRLNLAFSMFFLVVIYFLITKLFSEAVSIPVVLFLALNEHFSKFSINLWCENMFTLWGTLCWGTAFLWLNFGKKKNRWVFPILFGFFSGLAYLTKENGLFFPLIFIVVLFGTRIISKIKKKKTEHPIPSKEIFFFIAIFLIFAIPYWITNFNDTGSISRTYELKGRFWLDQGIQSYIIHDSIPTFSTYLQSHTLGQMITKMGIGLKKQFFGFIELFDLSPEWTFGKTIPIGWVLFPLSLYGLFVALKKEIKYYSLLLFFIWYLLFSWYHHIDTAPRFIFPLFIILLISATLAASDILLKVGKFSKSVFPSWLKWVIPGLLILLFLKTTLFLLPTLPVQPAPLDPDRKMLLNYYLTKTSPNDIIAYGPSHGFSLRWITKRREILIPLFETLDEFLQYLDEYHADYLMLDMEIVHRRSWIFENVIENRPQIGLVLKSPIPGWKPVLNSINSPRMYFLFKRDKNYDRFEDKG